MSWSIDIRGTPDVVAAQLAEQSERLGGQSKVEFDDALPFLTGLVLQNFSADGQPGPTLRLRASGYGSASSADPPVQLERLAGG